MRPAAVSLLLALALFGGGCGQVEVSAEDWAAMTRGEKEMVVRAQLGAETAADAKGGKGRRYPLAPGEYVDRIDAIYGAGESRPVAAIWPELAE